MRKIQNKEECFIVLKSSDLLANDVFDALKESDNNFWRLAEKSIELAKENEELRKRLAKEK